MENKLQHTSDMIREFPLESLLNITNNFSEEHKIGGGGYAKVYKGVLDDGEEIALKKLHYMPGLDDSAFSNEFSNLMKARHKNITRLIGYCYHTGHQIVEDKGEHVFALVEEKVLCIEYLQNGSLDKYLSDEPCGLDWHICYKIIKGVCEGLNYLHNGYKDPIYHMDLKPANILLDKDMTPKIGDFGLSRLFPPEHTYVTKKMIGTFGYMPPEYIERGEITNKFDVFSLGVIIIKIIAGDKGYSTCPNFSSREFVEHVHENWRNRMGEIMTSHTSEEVITCLEIALECVEVNRVRRPTISEVVTQLNKTNSVKTSPISEGNLAFKDSDDEQIKDHKEKVSKSAFKDSDDERIEDHLEKVSKSAFKNSDDERIEHHLEKVSKSPFEDSDDARIEDQQEKVSKSAFKDSDDERIEDHLEKVSKSPFKDSDDERIEDHYGNKCAACYHEFNRMVNLKHMRLSHHSEHEPRCGVCGNHYRTFDALRDHLGFGGVLPKASCARAFAAQGCPLCLTVFHASGAALRTHRAACQLSRAPTQSQLMRSMSRMSIQGGRPRGVVALGYKVVGGGNDGTLDVCARVCIIDENEIILYESFVKPHIPVTDYRYKTTGIRPEYLHDSRSTLKRVRKRVEDILFKGEQPWNSPTAHRGARLLVGHGLDHVLVGLGIDYPACLKRDTATYPPLMKTSRRRMMSNSLKFLTRSCLGYEIQNGGHQHYDDCVAAMRLYKKMREPDYHCWCLDD